MAQYSYIKSVSFADNNKVTGKFPLLSALDWRHGGGVLNMSTIDAEFVEDKFMLMSEACGQFKSLEGSAVARMSSSAVWQKDHGVPLVAKRKLVVVSCMALLKMDAIKAAASDADLYCIGGEFFLSGNKYVPHVVVNGFDPLLAVVDMDTTFISSEFGEYGAMMCGCDSLPFGSQVMVTRNSFVLGSIYRVV